MKILDDREELRSRQTTDDTSTQRRSESQPAAIEEEKSCLSCKESLKQMAKLEQFKVQINP